MSFTLHEVSNDAEFESIIAVANAGYSRPFNGLWEILKGPSIEQSVDECASRYALWHRSDPTSRWIYVSDTSGKVLGGMQWNIHEKNPYEQGAPKLPAYWWPEGDMKTLSDMVLDNFFKGRPGRMSKPHFLISYCFVHPEHRHRGVASMMMRWGLEKADAQGLDTFVESTEDGRGLYEAFDFVVIDKLYLDAEISAPSEEYSKLRNKLLPLNGYVMVREQGGQKEKAE
ncbi:hypothetical protein CJF30_00008681 [Rutstroemia sp. NJR-2017a BBW]|nr:hypothetical protein CJF30_00008681 [Rutstroemia sp. NJR-2017a BBW]